MSHDTHQGHSAENQTIISFKNSFWLIIIIVGLFIAALNFVQAESADEGEGHAKTEHAGKAEGAGENGTEKKEEMKHENAAGEAKPAAAATADTTHKAAH